MFSYFACITNANLLPYDCISISKGLINHIVILGMKIKKKQQIKSQIWRKEQKPEVKIIAEHLGNNNTSIPERA